MAHVFRILEAGRCPWRGCGRPSPWQDPPTTLAAPWRNAAETLPLVTRFRCEPVSFIPPALPSRLPPRARTSSPSSLPPHPSTTSRPVRLPSALSPFPRRSPVLRSTCPDLCAFRPTSLRSARHGRVRPSLHLVHSNVTCCSLFAFLSPKQRSQFLNTLRELGISLIRLGINSSKQF